MSYRETQSWTRRLTDVRVLDKVDTPPRLDRRAHRPDFKRILTIIFINFVKSLNSFLISLEFPPEETLKRGTCQTSFKLKYSGYHFSRTDELLYETPQNMKIMKILKIVIFSQL